MKESTGDRVRRVRDGLMNARRGQAGEARQPARVLSVLLSAACAAVFASAACATGGGPSDYVALGDSVTQARYLGSGYVERYAGGLAGEVRTRNLGVGGWKSADLLRAVEADEEYRTALADAERVTLLIGLNDLQPAHRMLVRGNCGGERGEACYRRAVARFGANLEAILDEAETVRGGLDGVVLGTVYDPYQGRDDRPRSDKPRVTRRYYRALNDRIRGAADRRHLPVATVAAAFNGPRGRGERPDYFMADHVHPDEAGMERIAEEFAAASP